MCEENAVCFFFLFLSGAVPHHGQQPPQELNQGLFERKCQQELNMIRWDLLQPRMHSMYFTASNKMANQRAVRKVKVVGAHAVKTTKNRSWLLSPAYENLAVLRKQQRHDYYYIHLPSGVLICRGHRRACKTMSFPFTMMFVGADSCISLQGIDIWRPTPHL